MNRKFIQNSNFVLHKILHSNNSFDVLKNFVEAFLKISIKSIKINANPIVNGKKSKDYGIVDMRVLTNKNEELNVGIQIVDGDYIQNKMFLYYAKIHSNQVLYGDKRKIARTVTINILDMKYFSSEKYHKIIRIRSNIINDSILETMELHVIELPKFNKNVSKNISDEDAWTMYFKGQNEDKITYLKQHKPKIYKLDKMLENYWKKEKI